MYHSIVIVTTEQVEGEEEFQQVSKRKRKSGSQMEAEDGTSKVKRPSFPPVDASTTLVHHIHAL